MTTLSFDTETIELFRRHLEEAKEIAIISHTNPDGDNVGSVLGLREIIAHHLDKRATAVLPDACPDNFYHLQGAADIISADSHLQEAEEVLRRADLIICLDFNDATRVGRLQQALRSASGYKIMVDHHLNPDSALCPLVFSIPDLSSTCEMLYWLTLQAWGAQALNTAAARCLYFGLCTDTGSFSYACEDSSLYMAAAGLTALPIHAAEIHNEIDNTFSSAKMRFLGFLLSERLRIFEEEGLAYFFVSQEDMHRFHVQPSDVEGIVNYTLMMKKICVGAMIRESEDDIVRLSLRSKYDFDVNLFAKQHFGGGGHAKASGATLHGTLADCTDQVEQLLLNDLKHE